MTRLETPFVTHRELIIVEALVTGPRAAVTGRFVLDTGAVYTTITPELADTVGYSARDGIQRTRVRTAIGSEQGYVLAVATFVVLGLVLSSFAVHVFDLGHDDIDGLVGLNFLSQFNYEVRSAEHRILVEPVAPVTR
jgi:predicted aspartyl protease